MMAAIREGKRMPLPELIRRGVGRRRGGQRGTRGVRLGRLVTPSAGLLCACLLISAQPLAAQRFRGRRSMGELDCTSLRAAYDGRFAFLRLRYAPAYGERRSFFGGDDGGWAHDCPRAERHLTTILRELSSVTPNTEASNVFAADDPEIFKYPVAYLSEPGGWTLTEAEATNLRNYLLKGGFLIVDDFEGPRDWRNFGERVREVLPDAQLVPLDPSHPIFNAFFAIESLDHRHPYFSVMAEYYGIFEDNDPKKRLAVIVNYNNDIGESWEWSDTGLIPVDLTNEAYKLGVNYIVYGMTH